MVGGYIRHSGKINRPRGFENDVDGVVKPPSPFNMNFQRAIYSEFINFNDGSIMGDPKYWEKIDTIFSEYMDYLESKFDRDVSTLYRKHVTICSTMNTSKESNNLEETYLLRVNASDYQVP